MKDKNDRLGRPSAFSTPQQILERIQSANQRHLRPGPPDTAIVQQIRHRYANPKNIRVPMNLPDFRNKIILLYLFNRPDDHNVVLQDASLENQAGRMFVVGVFAEGTTANDWAAGVRTAVAWDSVEQYLVFDTIESYFERISIGWENKTVQ